MLVLDGTTAKLKVQPSAAGSIDISVSYADYDSVANSGQGGSTVGAQCTNIATTTDTDVAGSPTGTNRRVINGANISNVHLTVSNTVTVRHLSQAGVTVQLQKWTLLPGESMVMNDAGVWFVYDILGGVKATSGAAVVAPSTNEFRLSGVTGQSVMQADSTALSTVYLAQHRGNRIGLYDGANWQLVTPATEINLAVTGRTTDLPFDVFAFIAGGTVALEFLNWSTATARATGLSRQDGVWIKTGDATRRYLGSIRARSATTYHWVRNGVDLPAKFDLFNADNRIEFGWTCLDSATSHAYSTATIRQWAGSVNYQCDFMVGLQEEDFGALGFATSRNATASIARAIGMGLDSTTQFAAGCLASSTVNSVVSVDADQSARLVVQPTIGRHFVALLQWDNAGTCTWVGDNGGAGTTLTYQSGMAGEWAC